MIRLEHAVSDSSVTTGFAAALSAVFDSAVVYLHPGVNVIVGARAAADFLHALPDLPGVIVEWRPLHVEVAADTSLALTWGTITSRPRTGGPAVTRFARYVAAWRRAGGTWRLAAFATSQLFANATAPVPACPAEYSGSVGAAFAAADRAFGELAVRRGAAESFHEYAAEDAVTFAANGLLSRGRDAIRAGLAGDNNRWRWHPVAAGASDTGDVGYTVGESEITTPGGQHYFGKYLTAWRKEPPGPRFIADIGNARPALRCTP